MCLLSRRFLQKICDDFLWGVAMAAHKTKRYNTYGKGLSIWDVYAKKKENKKQHNPYLAAISTIVIKMICCSQRHSGLSIPILHILARILPEGTGKINKEGIAFYHRVLTNASNSSNPLRYIVSLGLACCA